MDNRRDLALRVVVAGLLIAGLFAIRWDHSLQHFDFQTWTASDAVLAADDNPYDSVELNAELAGNPDIYGPHWATADDNTFDLHLLNPPSWLAQLRLLGMSAFVMSAVGALALYGSIVALSRRDPFIHALAYLGTTTLFLYLSPSATSFRLGQTGLLLAGLVGVRLVWAECGSAGTSVALLSFKPHLALAAAAPDIVRSPLRFARSLAVPATLLVGYSIVLYGVDPWFDWLRELTVSRNQGNTTDMSIRTLFPDFGVTSSLGLWGMAVAVIAIVAVTLRWRDTPPAVTALAALALMAFLSGHAFSHDWLWMVLVPVVMKWRPLPTLIVGFTAGAIYTMYSDVSLDEITINPKSLLGLSVVIYLVAMTATQGPEPAVVVADPELVEQPA
ncbi:MAG: DUF2029 domain-containing protein [Acidimicrobiales bacterium]|nr:DUF2029 domain-containing protein [Acidimicrobiales bacterium]RZV45992.1 MAG: DUF2029 domain-containing protein [Acidimicrobiales bacterium]